MPPFFDRRILKRSQAPRSISRRACSIVISDSSATTGTPLSSLALHAGEIAGRDRLLDGGQLELCQSAQLLDRFAGAPGAVGVGAKLDFFANGAAHRLEPRGVVRGADFDFDLAQAQPRHPLRERGGFGRAV